MFDKVIDNQKLTDSDNVKNNLVSALKFNNNRANERIKWWQFWLQNIGRVHEIQEFWISFLRQA